jgi:hypothetical protein
MKRSGNGSTNNTIGISDELLKQKFYVSLFLHRVFKRTRDASGTGQLLNQTLITINSSMVSNYGQPHATVNKLKDKKVY